MFYCRRGMLFEISWEQGAEERAKLTWFADYGWFLRSSWLFSFDGRLIPGNNWFTTRNDVEKQRKIVMNHFWDKEKKVFGSLTGSRIISWEKMGWNGVYLQFLQETRSKKQLYSAGCPPPAAEIRCISSEREKTCFSEGVKDRRRPPGSEQLRLNLLTSDLMRLRGGGRK